jgi:secondary thiamine-phosphate synthase enzyme
LLKKKEIKTDFRNQKINITNIVKRVVAEGNIEDGLCVVFVPHVDAGLITTTVDDPLVLQDISDDLTKIFPSRDNFNYTASTTKGSAHSKGSITGMTLNLVIDNKNLVLSDSQGIFFSEFVEGQLRECYIKLFGK